MVLAAWSQPMSLAKWLTRAGREDSERPAGMHGYGGSARDRNVATADAKHLGAFGRRAQHLRQIVGRTEFDDLGFRQFLADLGDHAIASAAARVGVDDQDDTIAVRPRRCLDTQRLGGGQGVVDDRRTRRRPNAAIDAPIAKPANTSPG